MPLPVALATWTLRLPRIGPVVTPILSAASMRESMSAMSVAPRVSERVGDSGQGIPTLPPPVLPGSGSTGRGLFRSQPVPSHRLPGDGGDYRGAWAEGEGGSAGSRSEEHTSELQSLMRISYAVFCLKKKKNKTKHNEYNK